MARSDMSDLEWNFIKALLPNKHRGVKRVDDHIGRGCRIRSQLDPVLPQHQRSRICKALRDLRAHFECVLLNRTGRPTVPEFWLSNQLRDGGSQHGLNCSLA